MVQTEGLCSISRKTGSHDGTAYRVIGAGAYAPNDSAGYQVAIALGGCHDNSSKKGYSGTDPQDMKPTCQTSKHAKGDLHGTTNHLADHGQKGDPHVPKGKLLPEYRVDD